MKGRGGQNILSSGSVNDPVVEKYQPKDGITYYAVDRKDGTRFDDVKMNSIKITNHILSTYGVTLPTLYDRKKYYLQSGNYWWEQWLDVHCVDENGNETSVTDQAKNITNIVSKAKEKVAPVKASTKRLTWDVAVERMKAAHPGENLEYPIQELTDGVRTKIRVIDHDMKPDGTEYGEYTIEVRSHIAGNGYPGKKRAKNAEKRKVSWPDLVSRMKLSHPNENLEYPEQELTNGVHTKIRIIDHDLRPDGTEYGEYIQDASSHIAGCGHPMKGKERSAAAKSHEWEEYVERMKAAHPGENLEYPRQPITEGVHTKITIIDHDKGRNGEEYGPYVQEIKSHINGASHPRKANEKRAKANRHITREEYIERFKEIFGDDYTYDKFEYYGYREKSIITCKEHGDFEATPGSLIQGHGCPKCGNVYHSTLDELKERFDEMHHGKYDYSLIETFNNAFEKLPIICPDHGMFEMSANKHLKGQGCPQCGIESSARERSLGVDEFIRKATEKHNGKYTYVKDEINYVNNSTKVPIHCDKHGVFYQSPQGHLAGNGCPKCVSSFSKNEEEVYKYVLQFCPDAIQHDRKILCGQELDIYIPSKNIAIEYNGVYWHTEKQGKDRNYHLSKTLRCNEQGIKLYQIFEDEYLEHKDVVLRKIKHLLGQDMDLIKVGARSCRVKMISKDTAKEFLDKYHIQGFSASTIYLGAVTKKDDILVGVMTFKQENSESNNWELTRFATNWGYCTPGLGGKMFAWFVREFTPDAVKSFADRRWTQDIEHNLYTSIGFKLDKIEKPDYRYLDDFQRKHKFLFRKQILAKRYGLPLTMTESEMCDYLGFERIWDCGLIKYVWKA